MCAAGGQLVSKQCFLFSELSSSSFLFSEAEQCFLFRFPLPLFGGGTDRPARDELVSRGAEAEVLGLQLRTPCTEARIR